MTKGTVKKQKKTMTDDRCDSKKQKKPSCVRARIYVRRKVFYILSVISVICHKEGKEEEGCMCIKNRCMYFGKQVHLFGSLGAPI